MTIVSTDPHNPKRLPLWKSALEDLREGGIVYGQTIAVSALETALCSKDGLREFNIAISKIRRELEKDGFYISGQGRKAKGVFTIVPANENVHVAKRRQSRATDELHRGMTLLTTTLAEGLNDAEKRQLTATLERIQTKLALQSRALKVMEIIRKHAPTLLERPRIEDAR